MACALGVGLHYLRVALEHGHLSAITAGYYVVDGAGRFLAQYPSTTADGYGYWPLVVVPERIAQATLALEDRRFGRHPGVDPLAVLRAAWQNATSGRRRSGASTIAMQIARMQRPAARRLGAKLEEAAVAVVLTQRHAPENLLRHYLTIVPYGNRIHGIAAAAQVYLGKPVADLSWAEIAFLAAIPQAPALSNPYTQAGRARARRRGAGVLSRLHARSVIDAPVLATALTQLERLAVRPRPRRPPSALHPVLHMGERLRRAPPPAAVVRTTLDRQLQGRVHDLARTHLADWRAAGADNVAAAVVDLRTHAVRAWVGSTAYVDGHDGGKIDFARVPRSPGSTLKPFIYALALERGVIRPDTVLSDGPSAAGISNADRRHLGPLLPRQALANSRNLPAIRVLQRAGLENAYWMLHRVGVHDSERPPAHYGLGLAIGAMPTTLERLLVAYGAIASDGVARDLRWFEHEVPEPRRALGRAASRWVTLFLADPQARLPSFQRMGSTDYAGAVAIKTGTSQGYRDAWTFAWTPTHLVGVWVGRADARPMQRLSGASSAAHLAKAILAELDGQSDRSAAATGISTRAHFEPPAQAYQALLCAYTGAQAGPGCARQVREWLDRPARPGRFSRLAYDVRSATPATPSTPARYILVRDALRLDPRQAIEAPPTAHPAAGGLQITSPVDGLRVLRIPDLPADRQTLALRVAAGAEPVPVVWRVNGEPFRTVLSTDTLRWPLRAGVHRIDVAYAGRSPTTSVQVTVD